MQSIAADLYIAELDMLLCIDGPNHYRNNSLIPIDSTIYSDKIFKKYHKHLLRLDYKYFDAIFKSPEEFDYKNGAAFLKAKMEEYFLQRGETMPLP